MKKAFLAVVLLVGGLLGYNFATTGELTLVPSFTLSEEERQLKDLDSEFKSARKTFASAHRSAAVSGVDFTADAESARRAVERIEKELEGLKKRLGDESVMQDAEELAQAIVEFKRQLR